MKKKMPKLPQTGGQYQRDKSGRPVKGGVNKAPSKPAKPQTEKE